MRKDRPSPGAWTSRRKQLPGAFPGPPRCCPLSGEQATLTAPLPFPRPHEVDGSTEFHVRTESTGQCTNSARCSLLAPAGTPFPWAIRLPGAPLPWGRRSSRNVSCSESPVTERHTHERPAPGRDGARRPGALDSALAVRRTSGGTKSSRGSRGADRLPRNVWRAVLAAERITQPSSAEVLGTPPAGTGTSSGARR